MKFHGCFDGFVVAVDEHDVDVVGIERRQRSRLQVALVDFVVSRMSSNGDEKCYQHGEDRECGHRSRAEQ